MNKLVENEAIAVHEVRLGLCIKKEAGKAGLDCLSSRDGIKGLLKAVHMKIVDMTSPSLGVSMDRVIEEVST